MALRRTLLTSAARAQEIFCDLLDLPAAQRETAARRRCRTDDAVRTEVLRLLRLAEPARGAFEPPPMVAWRSPEDEIGRVVGGRWWLDRLIGGGGSGDVYEAHDCRGEQRAALKLVRGLSRDGTHAVRREIALLRWLRIPGVVRLIDDGAEHGAVFCVMDLLDGLPFPGKRRSRSWDDLEAPALSLLEAVAGVHEAGVVHCDLKPRNVLVDARGRLTILDLGISAETRHSYGAPRPDAPQATPAYASPEQLRGGETDPRWDLYAIGVMLFESLAGRHPDGPPRRACERLAAPPAVRRTVASLLAPLPGSRPRSARDVIETLRPSARTHLRRRRWTEHELRARFAGPDLLLHLREDAAKELFRRTAGRPLAVGRELTSWVRSGLARIGDGTIVVDRASLERLHRLAATSGAREPQRAQRFEAEFVRALRRGEPADVARSARRVAAKQIATGRPAAAMAALFEGAAAARAAGVAQLEMRVLRDAAVAAVRTAMASELDRALYLLQRAAVAGPRVADLETVVRAALHIAAGRPREALETVRPVCEAGSDTATARLAWSVHNGASRLLGSAEERRGVAALRRWLRHRRVRGASSVRATAEGWLLYRDARFAEAATMHLAAARTATDAHSRNRCLLDAASAAVDGGRRDAAALAARARRVAAALRNPVHEGRAVHIQRTILLRSGRATAPDREFVDAFCLLGVPGLSASAALTEAAIAWRLRDAGATRELAMTAAGSWGESPRGDAARALAAAAGEPLDDATLRRCQDSASHRLPPAVGAQALALLCLARPHWRDSLRAARAALRIPRQIRDRGAIREILCLAEADAILRDESDESQHRRCSARATPCADAPGRRVPSSADPP